MSGQVRKTNQLESKIEESIRLGFTKIIIPKTTEKLKERYKDSINIYEISNVNEAINISLKKFKDKHL